jgi:hypothetical protein
LDSESFFTRQQLDALVSALPNCTSRRRRALLHRILKEWGASDLKDHLSRPAPSQTRAERKQMERLAKLAGELAQVLEDIGSVCRFHIATMMLPARARSLTRRSTQKVARRLHSRLTECPTTFRRLEAATTEAAASWVPLPVQAENLQRYLVLLDLAAIFEWASGQHAGRRVRTDTSEDAGKEYGPFYDFVRAVWPIIFGSERGLSNALKDWAKRRALYREESPLIWNMDLRHPEWRIWKQ